MRSTAAAVNHAQPGDPLKAAQVIVATIDSGYAPRRLRLGSNRVAGVEENVTQVIGELASNRERAISCDYTQAAA
jgi:hypothetical protein